MIHEVTIKLQNSVLRRRHFTFLEGFANPKSFVPQKIGLQIRKNVEMGFGSRPIDFSASDLGVRSTTEF